MTNAQLGIIGNAFTQYGHLDLIAVMVSVAAIGIMGFVVLFHNPKSATNRAFLIFSLFTIAYGSANYLSYQATNPLLVLWLLRMTMFFAVWHAFSFFYLFFSFPKERIRLPRFMTRGIIPITVVVSVLTLTKYVFASIHTVAQVGYVTNPTRGPAISVFAMTAGALVVAGLYQLFRKTLSGPDIERKQSRIVLIGAAITFALILTFNLILPLAFNILGYIPLAPIFFIPFILLMTHAIRKYRMLDTKIITTELIAFVLIIINIIEILVAKDVETLILRVGVFTGVLVFSIMLIQSVIREVQQRDQLAELAKHLRVANAKLEDLDQLKDQFLSFASHQLRTPLTAIKWQSQLLLDGTLGTLPERALETAQEIEDSSDRMIELVNEFLNVRKLQQGRMEYAFAPIDIAALTKSVVDRLRRLAEHKKLKLTFLNTAPKPLCSVDEQKFTQVIQNLVDNAVKYTDEGSITVHVEEAPGRNVHISVSDTGHGIDASIIDHLFEQFIRGGKDAKHIEGTGLGLFIAKQVVTAHRGRIWASSAGPGKGSIFTVELPLL